MTPTLQTPIDNAAAQHRTGLFAGVAAYAVWGLFPIFFHALAPTSPIEVLAHRIVWTGLFVVVLLAVNHRWEWLRLLIEDRSVRRRAWAAGLLISVNWLTYVWAVDADRVLDASLGYFINPLISVLLGVTLLGENVRPAQRIALAIGAAAVVVLSVGYGEFPIVGIVLALSFGFYGYIKKGLGLDGLSSLAAETTITWPFAVIGLAVMTIGGSTTFLNEGTGLDVLLVLAGPITAVPLILFGVAAPRLPLVTIGLLQYITPLSQLVIGWVVFHEPMPPQRLAGFVLIWLALGVLAADTMRTRAGKVG